ncbi:MAG TPA: PQQ-dependent sugar dehydrogenase [Chloroflexota bacterium]|nr:PQQ-dependent sugar dehydrogenase [Chloroflexota bacterium]
MSSRAVGSTTIFSSEQMASTARSLHPVSVAGHSVNLPAGFTISVFASGLSAPRFMAFDGAGNLAVAEDGANRVLLFRQQNGRLSATPEPIVSGLNDPTSVAFYQNFLYVAEARQISRYPYQAAAFGPRQVIVPGLPAATDHHTRTIIFGPDGKLYLAMGSPCNVCVISNPLYAAISRYNPDGSGYEPFAKGLRNAVGLAFQPGASLLWATVNGRDSLGDNIPWDLLTTIHQGGDYGFPGCYDNRQVDPQFGRAGGCGGMALPDVGIQAHSAPLGLTFYTGNQFPAEYRDDILVANHGSWNRSVPTGYDVVRAHFAGGGIASVTDFATGWAPPGSGRIIQTPYGLGTAGAWGRPVQPVVAPDGSLYLSDDYLGAIYRISYSG